MTLELDSGVSSYLSSMFDPEAATFRFFAGGPSTILSTSFGIQTAFLFSVLADYPVERIGSKLQSQQIADGLFVDTKFTTEDAIGVEREYLLWQFSYFATIALDMMGKKPLFPFAFLAELGDEKHIADWFSKQNFSDFWYTSNKIMFLLYFLAYEQARMAVDNRKRIGAVMRLLDAAQKPSTGFWGDESCDMRNGMFGAAHIYLFYDYFGLDVPLKEKIIDNTIALGDSHHLYGGACEDYDAVEILTRLQKQTNYRQEDVVNVLRRISEATILHRASNGGFPYRFDMRSVRVKLQDVLLRTPNAYSYSGWNSMRSQWFKPDLWGTYFRALSVAKISKTLDPKASSSFRFYSLPGWGY